MRKLALLLLVAGIGSLAAPAAAEVIYLVNGDIIHGELVSANNTSVTLQTKYGKLDIPKEDIKSIGEPEAAAAAAPGESDEAVVAADPASMDVPGHAASLSFNITGRSFWYAFDGTADTRIRMSLDIGNDHACSFVDSQPDTVDGDTLYNSFTFSPDDAVLAETADGFECAVQKTEDGNIWLAVSLAASEGQRLVRMSYAVADGGVWNDVISRAFSVDIAPGQHTVVSLQQDASALAYSGLFKKEMKNLDAFQLQVLSTELR